MSEKITSVLQFVTEMHHHRRDLVNAVERGFDPSTADAVFKTGRETRRQLRISELGVTVLYGEQGYGLNESPKVLGKRVLARAVAKHDVHTVEMFAIQDVVGSESGIYRATLPNPQSNNGELMLNVLPGWKRLRDSATSSFASPTSDQLAEMCKSLSGLYGNEKAEAFVAWVNSIYTQHPNNYGLGQAHLLMDLERHIGLSAQQHTTEDILDTAIAANGGMEIMLGLWPRLAIAAGKYPVEGVRVPDPTEAPFVLYHNHETDGSCGGRMNVSFVDTRTETAKASGIVLPLTMESAMQCSCLECKSTVVLTPEQVLHQRRPLTWRAMPRVAAYSLFGIAEGHITGGGSVYNAPTAGAMKELGLPYFPLMNMDKRNADGDKVGIFIYDSYLTRRKGADKQKFHAQAIQVVTEGRAAMMDMVLSLGRSRLRDAVEATFQQVEVTPRTRIVCQDPMYKGWE